ncbi:MAG: hypothetical protein VW543_13610, partial [Deltaproteobacteria bacterium]
LYDLNELFRKNDFEVTLLKEEVWNRVMSISEGFGREFYKFLSSVYTADRNKNLLIARKNNTNRVKNFLFQDSS